VIRQGPCDGPEKPCHKPDFPLPIRLDERIGDLSLAEKAHPFAEKIACEMDSQSYRYELDGLAIKPANPNRWGNSKCVLRVE
jgi:hypothetical protein